MKRTFYATISMMCLVSFMAQAEDVNTQMGNPTLGELTMTSYSSAPDAPAVVLYSNTEVEFQTSTFDYTITYTHQQRVKVLNDKGIKAGQVTIPYYKSQLRELRKESISGLKVTTYNLEDGKVCSYPISKDSIFEERLDATYMTLSFHAPQVRPGSVIEYSYTLNSDYIFSPEPWYIQGQYPVAYAQYSFNAPVWCIYNCEPQGTVPLIYKQEDSKIIHGHGGLLREFPGVRHHFSATHVPAVQTSGLFPSASSASVQHMLKFLWYDIHGLSEKQCERLFQLDEDLNAITDDARRPPMALASGERDIQLRQYLINRWESQSTIRYYDTNITWPEMVYSAYWKEFYDARSQMSDGKIAQYRLPESLTTEQRIDSVRRYVHENYGYKGLDYVCTKSSLRQYNHKKQGLCLSDLTKLTFRLLRSAGVNACPVVLRPRSQGPMPLYPAARYLTASVIAVLQDDGSMLLFDPTSTTAPVGVLPADYKDAVAYVVLPDHAESIAL